MGYIRHLRLMCYLLYEENLQLKLRWIYPNRCKQKPTTRRYSIIIISLTQNFLYYIRWSKTVGH